MVRLLFEDAENKLYESVSGLSGQVLALHCVGFTLDMFKELLERLNFKNTNSE